MSEENVEIVRESFRRFEANDFDGLVSLWHSDARVTAPEGWPEQGPFEGRDAIIDQFRRLTADWEKHSISDVEVAADDAGWVVVTFRWDVRGAESGIATTANLAVALHLKDGKFTEGHYRRTRKKALEAAGLKQ